MAIEIDLRQQEIKLRQKTSFSVLNIWCPRDLI